MSAAPLEEAAAIQDALDDLQSRHDEVLDIAEAAKDHAREARLALVRFDEAFREIERALEEIEEVGG